MFMNTLVAPKRMTAEELQAIPDDGIDRWLINGELREGGLTIHNYKHSRSMRRFSRILLNWLVTQPQPRGDVVDGEAGFRLRTDPATVVGTDVAYIGPDLADAHADAEGIVNGVPILVVEILSPSDEHADVAEKTETYLDCGVKLVWIVDPYFETVTVYAPDRGPVLFNASQIIDAEPHLPGFRSPVTDFFAR